MSFRYRLARFEILLLAPLYFFAVNFVRSTISHASGDHTLFDIGYALAPVFLWMASRYRFPRPLRSAGTFLIALVVIAGDVLGIVARRFGWGPNALLDFLHAPRDLPWRAIWPAVFAVILAALLASVPLAMRSTRPFRLWPLTILLFILAGLDFSMGENRVNGTSSGVNILAMSSLSALKDDLIRRADTARLTPFPGATLAGELPRAADAPRQILSVGVESLGYLRGAEERRTLLGPLLARLAGQYRLAVNGTHQFHGMTLPGEMRELCGVRLAGEVNGTAIFPRLRRDCLPARLAARGYETDALHGNGGGIYDRAAVYPAMGFRRSWFFDDLKRDDPRVVACPDTAFGAACDERVFARALALFDGRPRFVHVMTVDTHLPIPDSVEPACPAGISGTPTICRYAAKMRGSLAELGAAIRRAPVPPDRVVLYGDHAPPFFGDVERDRFVPGVVPYLVLERVPAR